MGELSGILCALCWAVSATLFSHGSQRIGSNLVNRLRLLFGLVLILSVNLLQFGSPWPLHAAPERWLWLGLSGVLGLAIGDGLMYYAYTLIGTRIAMLVTAFSPILSALIAWIFLGETLGSVTLVGICLTIAGIAVVTLARDEIGRTAGGSRKYFLGLLVSFIAVNAYAAGMVMSKKGLQGDFPPIAGVAIRMSIATVFSWSQALVMRQAGGSLRKVFADRSALRSILIGSVIGPFIGIWLSMIAIQKTHVGVASTLISMAPVFLLPIAKWVQKETVSRRAVAGTLLSLVGVAVIFLVK